MTHEEHILDRDGATALPSKYLFYDRLTQALALARRNENCLAVLFLSFDNLKLINDNLGRNSGDELLRNVAGRITAALRKSDTAARPGGSEFMILLPEVPRGEYALVVANKIVSAFGAPLILDGREFFINVSIGISIFPGDGAYAESLIKNAYTALQHALSKGQSAVLFYSPELNNRAFETMLLENSLRLALQREEFVVHYQPQIDLRTGSISGVEALVRWQKPGEGLVYPASFITVMENAGLIGVLGEWVLRRACLQCSSWQQDGIGPLRVAVNLSAKQFFQQDVVAMVTAALREAGIDPGLLELELTESVFLRDTGAVVETLTALRKMGVHIAIDDFGTGYSSLSYLKLFPVSKLKMVEPFVSCLTIGKPDDIVIANMIVGMAHSLNMTVIAEGVENAENLEYLRSIKCDELQGYVLSHPLPPDGIVALLREEKAHLPPSDLDHPPSRPCAA